MNDREYDVMRAVEDTYWWYQVLRGTVADALAMGTGGGREARILDAGCGTGGMMEVLRARQPGWKLAGLDYSPHAVAYTRQRGFEDVVQGSVDALPFANESFDAVYSLDVLYIGQVDEGRAMTEFARVLKPGGLFLMNLPAFNLLRGQHDVAVHGARRYTPGRVRSLLEAAGLRRERVHCWNLWLFFPIACWRLISRVLKPADGADAKSDLSSPPAVVNRTLAALGKLDAAFCGLIRSPLGTSVWAVARKPGPASASVSASA